MWFFNDIIDCLFVLCPTTNKRNSETNFYCQLVQFETGWFTWIFILEWTTFVSLAKFFSFTTITPKHFLCASDFCCISIKRAKMHPMATSNQKKCVFRSMFHEVQKTPFYAILFLNFPYNALYKAGFFYHPCQMSIFVLLNSQVATTHLVNPCKMS